MRARAPGAGGQRAALERLGFVGHGGHGGLGLFARCDRPFLGHADGDARVGDGLIGGENESASDRGVGVGGNANANEIRHGHDGCGGAGDLNRVLRTAMVALWISQGTALLLCVCCGSWLIKGKCQDFEGPR